MFSLYAYVMTIVNVVMNSEMRNIEHNCYFNSYSGFYRAKFWSEYLKERDHSENLDVDRKILLDYVG
jgi:hypothetical protein